MHDQLKDYFEKLLSKYQWGFRKGFSTQHCLLVMIEKLRKSLDSGEASAALSTDLSKTFDCLPHDLLIAKLYAYGIKKGLRICCYPTLNIEDKEFVWIIITVNR